MIAEVIQSIGLVADGVGIFMVANGFKKMKIDEGGVYGIQMNTGGMISEAIDSARPGSIVLMLGFAIQLIGLWFGVLYE